MNLEQLKIYIDRLSEGEEYPLKENLTPHLLNLDGEDVLFKESIEVFGKIYLTKDHLVLHLNVKTFVTIPCIICNDLFSSPIHITNEYSTIPLSSLKQPIFYYGDLLRELILLEVPFFAECSGRNCSNREHIKKYLKEPAQKEEDVPKHFPFAHLDTI